MPRCKKKKKKKTEKKKDPFEKNSRRRFLSSHNLEADFQRLTFFILAPSLINLLKMEAPPADNPEPVVYAVPSRSKKGKVSKTGDFWRFEEA